MKTSLDNRGQIIDRLVIVGNPFRARPRNRGGFRVYCERISISPFRSDPKWKANTCIQSAIGDSFLFHTLAGFQPSGDKSMGEVIQFVPRSNPSRDLMLITPLDVWDYNALLFETTSDWLWDFCRAGYPNEPAVILSVDEPA